MDLRGVVKRILRRNLPKRPVLTSFLSMHPTSVVRTFMAHKRRYPSSSGKRRKMHQLLFVLMSLMPWCPTEVRVAVKIQLMR